MRVEHLVSVLDDPSKATAWLTGLGVDDAGRGYRNLTGLADSGLPLDLLAVICQLLEQDLPHVSDPDLALNTLERFVRAARSPLSFGSLVEQEPDALTVLLQLAATSQYLGDLLVSDPESYDLLRMTEGQPVARETLVEEIYSEVNNLNDPRDVMSALRRYKRRETLRIAFGDIIAQQRIETVTRQIAYLADAICEASIRFGRAELAAK